MTTPACTNRLHRGGTSSCDCGASRNADPELMYPFGTSVDPYKRTRAFARADPGGWREPDGPAPMLTQCRRRRLPAERLHEQLLALSVLRAQHPAATEGSSPGNQALTHGS